MRKRSSREDVNMTAMRIMREAIEEPADPVGMALVELEKRLSPEDLRQLAGRILGRVGGKAGGKARAANLSAKKRSAIARKAAQARWRDR